jgi:transcriptional regulator GlxA family with amidase domain
MTITVYFLPMARTRRVLIVLFDGVQTLDATGPAEVFASAARHLGRPVYAIEFLSAGGGERTTSSGLRVTTRALGRTRVRRDDIIVVAGGGERAIAGAMRDGRLVPWLKRAARRARRTTSVCSGAFFLGAAGLLDGRCAATHWSACARLAAMFPRARVDPNAIFVSDGNIWTSAGVTTGIDMALALVEQDLGADVANAVAARLVLYVRRPGFQSQFSDALVAQTTGADPLGPAIAWARANLAEVSIDALAGRAGLSPRTLHRRCLAQLGLTPAKLIERLRVEHARTLLGGAGMTAADLPIKSVAADTGFGSAARMNRAFSRALGVGPRAYRLLHAPSRAR